MKADLAIYSHVVDASGQCMSVSLILGFTLHFSSFDNLVSFYRSSLIYVALNSSIACYICMHYKLYATYFNAAIT